MWTKELIAPEMVAYHGRIFGQAGDGTLGEFGGDIGIVRCAAGLRHGMAERNAEILGDRHITLRIGMNIGDVIVGAAESTAMA